MPKSYSIADQNNNNVTTTQDGDKQRLDVNCNGGGAGGGAARYRTNFYNSKSDITVGSSDTQLVSLDFDGQLDGASVVFDREEVECILIIDGEEKFRAELKDLHNQSEYSVGDGSNGNPIFPVTVKLSGNQIIFHFAPPSDVTTNVTIKGKRKTSSTTKMYGIIVAYREKVVT